MRKSVGPWFRKAKNSWYVWHDGKRVNLKVKGEGNEEKAKKAWHRLMAGDDPTPPQSQEPTPPPKTTTSQQRQEPASQGETVPSLVKTFLADAQQRVKPESYRGYAKYLNPFSDAFKDTSRCPDHSPSGTVQQEARMVAILPLWLYRHVGESLSLGCREGLKDRSPIQGIKKPAKQSRGRKAVISADDHERLLAHAKGDWKDFLSLLWLTGCRPCEISGLTAADVDLANKCIVLTEHKTAEQTGKDRLIVLPDEAVVILQGIIAKRPKGLLFPGEDGQQMNANNISCRMRRLCQRAGVKAFAYGYRHTFATDALSSGVPDATVAALLGHSGTAMLHKHYSHLTSRTNVLREALGKVRS